MNEKLNIAELLKDCPTNMKLDCTIFEDVYFDCIDQENGLIKCYIQNDDYKTPVSFTEYGCYSGIEKSKCVIFPKGKTTWEGFQRPFKEGDVVTYKYENGLVSMILKKFVNFVEVHYHCALYDNAKGFITNNYIVGEPKYTHLATEEEKQKLFDAIKANGYKWNPETKTLEKLPKFKVGDMIQRNDTDYKPIRVIKSLECDRYRLDNGNYIKFGDEGIYKLLKFDIATLKAFDKVLVRQSVNGKWGIDFFGFYAEGFYYTTGSAMYAQCIPYEPNKELLGITDDCDDYFKTWE